MKGKSRVVEHTVLTAAKSTASFIKFATRQIAGPAVK